MTQRYLPLCPVANISVFVSFWALAPLLVCFAVFLAKPKSGWGFTVVLVVALFNVSVNDCVYVLAF